MVVGDIVCYASCVNTLHLTMVEDVSQFIAELLNSVEKEAIGSEMAALQAIYGEDSLELWQGSESTGSSQITDKSLRFQVNAK